MPRAAPRRLRMADQKACAERVRGRAAAATAPVLATMGGVPLPTPGAHINDHPGPLGGGNDTGQGSAKGNGRGGRGGDWGMSERLTPTGRPSGPMMLRTRRAGPYLEELDARGSGSVLLEFDRALGLAVAIAGAHGARRRRRSRIRWSRRASPSSRPASGSWRGSNATGCVHAGTFASAGEPPCGWVERELYPPVCVVGIDSSAG